jgi:DNA-binding ferritin-like protein
MDYRKLSRGCDVCTSTADLVSELMNARTSFHKMHLKITGLGSYAGHKALNELYDALPDHADTLAEQFQGAAEKILEYKDVAPVAIDTVEAALDYLRNLTVKVNDLQKTIPYSEIVNILDTFKETFNSIKYKLIFLK